MDGDFGKMPGDKIMVATEFLCVVFLVEYLMNGKGVVGLAKLEHSLFGGLTIVCAAASLTNPSNIGIEKEESPCFTAKASQILEQDSHSAESSSSDGLTTAPKMISEGKNQEMMEVNEDWQCSLTPKDHPLNESETYLAELNFYKKHRRQKEQVGLILYLKNRRVVDCGKRLVEISYCWMALVSVHVNSEYESEVIDWKRVEFEKEYESEVIDWKRVEFEKEYESEVIDWKRVEFEKEYESEVIDWKRVEFEKEYESEVIDWKRVEFEKEYESEVIDWKRVEFEKEYESEVIDWKRVEFEKICLRLEVQPDNHIKYLMKGLRNLGPFWPWSFYLILHSIAILGECVDVDLDHNAIDFLSRCQEYESEVIDWKRVEFEKEYESEVIDWKRVEFEKEYESEVIDWKRVEFEKICLRLEVQPDTHIEYLMTGLRNLGPLFVALEANWSCLCYWILHSIAILGL
ncbi:ERA1 protein [Tanacetum coccineum]